MDDELQNDNLFDAQQLQQQQQDHPEAVAYYWDMDKENVPQSSAVPSVSRSKRKPFAAPFRRLQTLEDSTPQGVNDLPDDIDAYLRANPVPAVRELGKYFFSKVIFLPRICPTSRFYVTKMGSFTPRTAHRRQLRLCTSNQTNQLEVQHANCKIIFLRVSW